MSDELFHFEHGHTIQGHYRFVKHLQIGSYGKVMLAQDMFSNEHVAVKIMSKAHKGSSAIARHEISILRRINNQHPNLCALLDHFETQSYHWMVFEYCSNGDLYDFIANSKGKPIGLHFKTLIKELYQILSFSHSKGIYHRDIKPENVLIDSSKSIKLTDWGLSTLAINAFDPLVGTEKYMAPETFFKQSKQSKPLHSYNTKAADYWSLGITLLYVLFKRCPWKLANISDENFKKFVEDPTVLFQWYPKLSKFGYECILQLLQLNPMHRNLDYFYQLSCVDGFAKSFVVEDKPVITIDDYEIGSVESYKSDTMLASSNDELLFGMEDLDIEPSIPSVHHESIDFELDMDYDQDDLFDNNEIKYNTPMTPAIATPMTKSSYKCRIESLNPAVIQNSPLKFERLDWYWNDKVRDLQNDNRQSEMTASVTASP